MKFAFVAALLSMTSAIKLKDDFLLDAGSVSELIGVQAEMNAIGSVSANKMEKVPDDLQVTYSQAMDALGRGD